MTSDEIRSFLDRFAQSWVRQDVPTLAASYTDDCVVRSPMFHTLKGRDQVTISYHDLFEAFSDATGRIEDVIIDREQGERAVLVWKVQSTHRGEIFGMPGTGKRIENTIVFIFTFRDGRIEREVRMYDFTSVLMQIGVFRAKPA